MNKALLLLPLLLVMLCLGATPKVIQPGSLVGWWSFEEGAYGSNAPAVNYTAGNAGLVTDHSGNGNTGSIACNASGQVQWVSGRFGKGLSINTVVNNGASVSYNQVYLGNTCNVQTGAFTVAGWLYQFAPYPSVAGLTTFVQPIWSHDYSLTFCAILYVQTNGAANMQLFDSNHNPSVNGVAVSNVRAWHHYVGVYNGSSTISVYQDGKLAGSASSGGFVNFSTTTPSHLGLWNNGARGGLYGILDDVRVYNRALSATEIAEMYFAKRGQFK